MSAAPGERFDRLADILDEAPTDVDAATLAAWLDAACDGDPWLREQSASLLKHRGAVDSSFLAPRGGSEPRLPAPERIDSFAIIRLIGSGGMGDVYLARQDGTERLVAVKLVRASHAGEELRARFEFEQQLLSRMDHPGIARVLSIGRTEGGEPWLAMDLVDQAVDLVTAATQRELGLRVRLEMMARVCDAVQHAHQKQVVHRDLKPGNIVISARDTAMVPRPRVIDFGVARLVDEVARHDFRTRVGQMIGTQAYMAPEQARDSASADVRSDVFALGAVLYELVTLRRAFTSAGGPPAVRPSQAGGPFPVEPDLELIIQTAIAEDPGLRYSSADAMAADLRRYLSGAPIAARRPTRLYLMRTFVRRHRRGVAASAAAVLLLAATAVIATQQAVRATRAEASTRQFAYRAGIVAAASAVREGDSVAATSLLDDLPDRTRHWERTYLEHRAREYERRIDDFDVYVDTIAHDAAGRPVVRPTLARNRPRTDPPQQRNGLLALAGRGLAVHGERAISWGDREIRVVDTATGTDVERVDLPFAVAVAAVREDELHVLADDGVLRRRRIGETEWETIALPELPPGSPVELRPLDDGSLLLLSWGGFTTVGGRSPQMVRFDGRNSGRPAVSANGELVAACRRGGRVVVHDVATGSLVREVIGLPADGVCVAVSAAAARVAVGMRNGAFHVVDLESGIIGVPRLGHVWTVTAMAFDALGRLWTGDFAGSVLRWSEDLSAAIDPAASGADTVLELGSAVSLVAFDAAGRLRTQSMRDVGRVWTGPDAEPAADPRIPPDSWLALPLPCGGIAATCVRGKLTLDRDGRRDRLTVFETGIVGSLRLSPDATRLAVGNDINGLAIIDLRTLEVANPEGLGNGTAIAWCDDDTLAVSEGPTLVLLDVATGNRRAIRVENSVTALLLLDPRRLVAGLYDGTTLEYALPSGTVTRRIGGHSRAVRSLALSPDRRLLATGDDLGTISIRDASDLHEFFRIELRADGNTSQTALSLAWSPDGTALASGNADGRARIWATGPPWARPRTDRADEEQGADGTPGPEGDG